MGNEGLGVAVLVDGLVIGGLDAGLAAVVDRMRPSSLSRVSESVGRPTCDPADGLPGTTLGDGLPIREVSRRWSVGSLRLGPLETDGLGLGAVGTERPVLDDLVLGVKLGRLEPGPLRLLGSNLEWAVRDAIGLGVLVLDRSRVGGLKLLALTLGLLGDLELGMATLERLGALKLRPLTLGLLGDLELGMAALERLGALKLRPLTLGLLGDLELGMAALERLGALELLPLPRLVAGALIDREGALIDGEGALIDGEGALAAGLDSDRPLDGRPRDDSFLGFSAATATATANASPNDRHPSISRRTAANINARLLVLELSIVSLPQRQSESYGKRLFERRAYQIVTI